MTDEDKKELADKIDDIIHDHTDAPSGFAADEIVAQLPQLLYQAGWMPPGRSSECRTGLSAPSKLPEHHINRDVLTSHLVELTAILHGR